MQPLSPPRPGFMSPRYILMARWTSIADCETGTRPMPLGRPWAAVWTVRVVASIPTQPEKDVWVIGQSHCSCAGLGQWPAQLSASLSTPSARRTDAEYASREASEQPYLDGHCRYSAIFNSELRSRSAPWPMVQAAPLPELISIYISSRQAFQHRNLLRSKRSMPTSGSITRRPIMGVTTKPGSLRAAITHHWRCSSFR